MDALQTESESHGIACTVRPKASLVSAGEEFVSYAREQGVDLIGVGTQNRSKVCRKVVRLHGPVCQFGSRLPGVDREVGSRAVALGRREGAYL